MEFKLKSIVKWQIKTLFVVKCAIASAVMPAGKEAIVK